MRERQLRCESGSGRSNTWTGVFIVLIGIAALVKVSNPDLPHWLFSWKTFLIALGLFIGFKHNFKGGAWFVLILVGAGFLTGDIYPEIPVRRYIWPMVLIVVGAFLIFRPRRNWGGPGEDKDKDDTDAFLASEKTYTKDDFVDSTTIFGGSKKIIISKNFKGGDIVNVFGGTELDLTQADMNGQAILELTTVFGGTTLFIPSNWDIKSEAVMIFGGVEDKRKMNAPPDSPKKILVIQGTVIFGGIDIKSF